MFLSRSVIQSIIEEAIYLKKLIEIEYYTKGNPILKKRIKAPFDLGTSNPKYYEKNKNQLYLFCFDHKDEKTGLTKPFVHGHDAFGVLKLKILDECFNPEELRLINIRNAHYDYKLCNWAIAKNRNWF